MISNNYPVELTPLDISSYRQGNTGVEYVTSFDSGRPGPHVMINAITHGNELCGVVALDYFFRNNIRPKRGKLTLSFANTAAYLTFDPQNPNGSRCVDEDFNRVWDVDKLNGNVNSIERIRAREMRPIVDQVDYLLDLHSLFNDTPPLLLAGALEKGKIFAYNINTLEYIVKDHGHAAGCRLRDYGKFGDQSCSENALLVECGQHWRFRSAEVAIETTLRFLLSLDMINADFAGEHLRNHHYPPQKFIEVTDSVTIQTEEFRFVEDYVGMEILSRAGSVIAMDGDKKVVTPYANCILIMPSRRFSPGLTAVRFGRIL